jgi:Cytochrome C oxidase, cbb3-type, subunit III
MSRGFWTAFWIILLLGVPCVGILFWMQARGVSARAQPSAPEAFVARRLCHLAIPRGARGQRNPVPLSSEVLAEASAHFADHCALCHANDGSGRTEIGRGLYPKTPDMRRTSTQSLSDGELFYIIHHGVRFTGMPGWGEGPPEEDIDSWELVHFVRHLPRITPDEIQEMEKLNPRSPSEQEEEHHHGGGHASETGPPRADEHR